jgi:hypothetical protein
MAEPPPYPDTGDDTGVGPGPGPATGMPRWVKVFVIIVIVLVVAFIVSRLFGVQHGPGLHTPPGGLGGHSAPIEQGAEQL